MSKSWHISNSSSIVTLVVDQEGLFYLVVVSFLQCFDMVGRDEGFWLVISLCDISPKVIFWNKSRRKTDEEVA